MRLINLQIKNTTEKGRGVFTTEEIEADQIIEICPVIVIPQNELTHLDKTLLYNYYFKWNEKEGAIALGYGSIYNHSDTPNATFEVQVANQSIIFKSIKTIKSNTEVLVDYTNGTGKLWWK